MDMLLLILITALFIVGMLLLGRESLHALDEWREDS